MRDGRRQLIYWHTLAKALGDDDQRDALDAAFRDVADELDLPPLLHDDRASLDQVVRQQPALGPLARLPGAHDQRDRDDADRGAMLFLKAVRNVFAGGPLRQSSVTAAEYSQWLDDVKGFEAAAGYAPGALLHGRGTATADRSPTTHADVAHALAELEAGRGLLSEPELKAGLQRVEKQLIDRMALREVLADPKLAASLTPSMALTEQLLREKGHLSGPALATAKRLIARFVEELGDVLAREVAGAPKGELDPSVPPKRVFRNLDLKRTLWANLINWDADNERLLVDRLTFRHRARKVNRTKLIVVVDQSGSMVSAMVNCTILASIFAGLPKVDAALVAYDTRALDLSPWVHDPFEVLLRTTLGGGTDGVCAIPLVQPHIVDPANTVVAWISDFYDNRLLMPWFTTLVRAGVTFIPVGSVSSGGYFSVDAWFREELKALGTPVLSGSLRTLVRELKSALPV